jgi:hypothetical protein
MTTRRSGPRRDFIDAPGHEIAALGAAVVVAERDGYSIVRKREYAGEVAELLDPRSEKLSVEGEWTESG